jgi:hypothetical protein
MFVCLIGAGRGCTSDHLIMYMSMDAVQNIGGELCNFGEMCKFWAAVVAFELWWSYGCMCGLVWMNIKTKQHVTVAGSWRGHLADHAGIAVILLDSTKCVVKWGCKHWWLAMCGTCDADHMCAFC